MYRGNQKNQGKFEVKFWGYLEAADIATYTSLRYAYVTLTTAKGASAVAGGHRRTNVETGGTTWTQKDKRGNMVFKRLS